MTGPLKILQFGANGQVSRAMIRAAAAQNVHLTALDRAAADLTNLNAVRAAIAETDADIVVNAAAYTAVDRAEEEADAAFAVNAAAPAAMARAAAARGLPLIHISTDYVFDGARTTPYTEEDATGPQTIYGLSKLSGEQAVRLAGGPHLILRTAWVYDGEGKNFVRTMLRLADTNDTVRVVNDQFGAPTHAADIADAIVKIAPQLIAAPEASSGVFHFSSGGETSWARFAEAVFEAAGKATEVNPIPSTDYPTPAKRPAYSVLNCAKIKTVFGVGQTPWRTRLQETLK